MSLRTRIAAAAGMAVALVVVIAAVAIYLGVRAELRGEVDNSLRDRAAALATRGGDPRRRRGPTSRTRGASRLAGRRVPDPAARAASAGPRASRSSCSPRAARPAARLRDALPVDAKTREHRAQRLRRIS